MPEQIRAAPQLGGTIAADYLIGIGTIDERMLILIDIDKLMSSDDIGLVRKLAA